MISPESRAEFEDLGAHEVQKKVDGVSYGPTKHREAIEWLEEQDPARQSVRLAKAAGTASDHRANYFSHFRRDSRCRFL